jgi:hypothetical protein
MTIIRPCYCNAEPASAGTAPSPEAPRAGTVRDVEADVIVLGELVGCLRCLAYIDGYLRTPSNGFCPDCGTHVQTLKKQQALRAILARRYETLEVS